jgi:ketosteroid isomerase-like protein
MTDDHTFIDSAGDIVPGKQEMLSVWEGFFAAYPDYQNIFQHLETKGDTVLILGYSTCSNEPTLDGPALWAAKVRDGLIAEWRVYEDTEDNRRQLGINM